MLSWIRSKLPFAGDAEDDVGSRAEVRTRTTRDALAEKHERDGQADLKLGRDTHDQSLMKLGRAKLQMSTMLKGDEASLLEALNLPIHRMVEDERGNGDIEDRNGA